MKQEYEENLIEKIEKMSDDEFMHMIDNLSNQTVERSDKYNYYAELIEDYNSKGLKYMLLDLRYEISLSNMCGSITFDEYNSLMLFISMHTMFTEPALLRDMFKQ